MLENNWQLWYYGIIDQGKEKTLFNTKEEYIYKYGQFNLNTVYKDFRSVNQLFKIFLKGKVFNKDWYYMNRTFR